MVVQVKESYKPYAGLSQIDMLVLLLIYNFYSVKHIIIVYMYKQPNISQGQFLQKHIGEAQK